MGFFKKFENHLIAPKADLTLQLDDSFVALGDSLDGTLTILPHEDIQAEEIRCEISCIETAQVIREEYDPALKRPIPRQVTEKKILYSSKPSCNPAIQLANGTKKDFKFSIGIPAGLRQTYQSVADSVAWEIKGVVAVHGRPDVTTKETGFQVVLQSQKPANAPPKIKLVSCQYCQTEMPEETLMCPNCGARRTAQ